MEAFEQGTVHPTAVVSDRAELGVGVTVGPFTVLNAGVRIGDRSVVGSHCLIGETSLPSHGGDDVLATHIGDDCVIRSHSVVYAGAATGSGLRTGNHVTIRERARIGHDVQIGTYSEIRDEVVLGDHCRLQSGVGLAPGTVVEEFVWIFPRTIAVDDPHPPSDTCIRPPTIRRYAVVGSMVTLMPGVEVGEHALVGAMALVTRDVAAETIVVGAPAKVVGSTRDVRCDHGQLDAVYPWPRQFRRGFPDGVLPPADEFR